MLEAAQKKIGNKRLNIADGATLDKATLMNQVSWPQSPQPPLNAFLNYTTSLAISSQSGMQMILSRRII